MSGEEEGGGGVREKKKKKKEEEKTHTHTHTHTRGYNSHIQSASLNVVGPGWRLQGKLLQISGVTTRNQVGELIYEVSCVNIHNLVPKYLGGIKKGRALKNGKRGVEGCGGGVRGWGGGVRGWGGGWRGRQGRAGLQENRGERGSCVHAA